MEDDIAKRIKIYCLRNFNRKAAIKMLYKPGQERHTEFDLSGLPKSSISEVYLGKLAKHVRFESVLQYVALPKLTIEKTTQSSKHNKPNQQAAPPDRTGLTDLKTIFKWLSRNEVQQILKVIAVDDGDIPHSDEAIKDSLENFEVEVWDWKKLDICSETILEAAPNATEISLYSTGNNAVLMGWYGPDGLKKLTKLKRVNLFIRKGLERKEILDEHITKFRRELECGPPETKITVDVSHDDKPRSFASGFRNDAVISQSENPWLHCMEDFAVFINSLHESDADKENPLIKIAVIDDGIDAALDGLDGKIARGESFCPYADSSGLMNAYYVPSGTHGTAMACLICKICPKSQLYVARLEEYQTVGGKKQFTAKSAANAILWAVECGVDVISMSWTIETPDPNSDGIPELKDAVEKAAKQNIIMFCSTSDQGSMTSESCYPGIFNQCIKIGAATATGEKCTWVHGQRIDFLLPGKDIVVEGGENKPQSGSSIATAIASGLGALLLYLNGRVKKGGRKDLKNLTRMKRAFKTLSDGGQFPFVRNHFGSKFKDQDISWEDMSWDDAKRRLTKNMDIITGEYIHTA